MSIPNFLLILSISFLSLQISLNQKIILQSSKLSERKIEESNKITLVCSSIGTYNLFQDGSAKSFNTEYLDIYYKNDDDLVLLEPSIFTTFRIILILLGIHTKA